MSTARIKNLALIPARGGSKGVPKKNIINLAGYPLIAYSIVSAKLSKYVDRVIVSTDDKTIADIARRYGAQVPFLRPREISQDNSTDLEVIQHTIGYFQREEKKIPELLVYLRPTTPLRIATEVDRAIKYIEERPIATSLRSVHELGEPPHKELQLDKNGYLEGFFPDDSRPEYYNLPRQSFPKAYHPNGYIDIVKTDFVQSSNFLYGSRMLGFITPPVTEVDRLTDIDYLQYQIKKNRGPIYEYLRKNFPRQD